jgi:hypothetical protein
MHVFIVFVNFLGVGLRRETSQTFLEAIDTHRLVRGDEYVNSEVEFMAIDE